MVLSATVYGEAFNPKLFRFIDDGQFLGRCECPSIL